MAVFIDINGHKWPCTGGVNAALPANVDSGDSLFKWGGCESLQCTQSQCEAALPFFSNIVLRNGVKITSQFDAILLPSSIPSFSLNSASIRLKRYLADAKIIGLKLGSYFDTVPKQY